MSLEAEGQGGKQDCQFKLPLRREAKEEKQGRGETVEKLSPHVEAYWSLLHTAEHLFWLQIVCVSQNEDQLTRS